MENIALELETLEIAEIEELEVSDSVAVPEAGASIGSSYCCSCSSCCCCCA